MDDQVLKDGQVEFHEQPAHLYTNLELLVTATGHVDDEPGSRKLYQLILDDFRLKKRQGTGSELWAELRRLKISSEGSPPAVKVLEETTLQDIRRLEIKFESEPGVEIEGKLHIPASPGRKPAVLLLADRTIAAFGERMAKSGRVVLELEPRDSSWGYDNRSFIGNRMANTRADHIGLNLPAMRAHDIYAGGSSSCSQ